LKTDGEGTMENPYIVNSPEKFNAIRYIATGEKRYFKQICDIDFSAICAVGGNHPFHRIIHQGCHASNFTRFIYNYFFYLTTVYHIILIMLLLLEMQD